MSMITRCPACGTSFRVTPQQLQAQHGMVRCGRCATVFDGFKALAAQRDVSPVEAPLPAIAVHGGSGIAEIYKPAAGGVDPPLSELESKPPRFEPTTPATVQGEIAPEPQASLPLQRVEAPEPAPPVQPRTVIEPEPPVRERSRPVVTPEPPATLVEASFESAAEPRRRSTGLVFGICLLLLGLAAQGVYFYRGDIAAQVPEARPYLNRMCEQLGCTVALPQRPRSISIEASDLQATDPSNPGLITLTATLRNQAMTTLGYPALDVVLTNAKEHTVARRIFLPADYLDAGKDARAGIPPNAETTIKLDIDSGNLGAAGFRLDLLAAPER